jgi:tetratricopeptide (TPR) repeat protein
MASLREFRGLDEIGAAAKTLYWLAQASRRSGDIDGAISFAMDGSWLAEKINAELSQGELLAEIAAAHYEKADLATAKGYAERALAQNVRLSSLARAGQASTTLAAVQRDQNDLGGAEQHARLAISLCHQSRDPLGEAVAQNLLGELFHKQARLDEAIEAWSSAQVIFEDIGDPRASSIRTTLNELLMALNAAPSTESSAIYSRSPDRAEPPAKR